jgi:competence protein ComEC
MWWTMPRLPHIAAYALLIAAALFLSLLIYTFFNKSKLIWIVCCGFLYASLRSLIQLENRWPEAAADERVWAHVRVVSIPQSQALGWSFDALVIIKAPTSYGDATRRMRLSTNSLGDQVAAGDCWRLLLALRPPRAALNPQTFDHERMLFYEGIQALGKVLRANGSRRLPVTHCASSLLLPVTRWRESLLQHIAAQVIDPQAEALISALAVGETFKLGDAQWRLINAAGLTHLIAISGLHITLLAWWVKVLGSFLWRIFLWRWLTCTRGTFASYSGLAAAALYSVLAGFSVPTQRTLIMLAVWTVASNSARHVSSVHILALALFLVLCWDPAAPLTLGFWLSFSAMTVILWGSIATPPRWHRSSDALILQATVSAALLPLSAWQWGFISIWSIPLNVIAVPIVSWVLVPLILLALLLVPLSNNLSALCLHYAEGLHNILWQGLLALADAQKMVLYGNISSSAVLLTVLTLLLLGVPVPARWRVSLLVPWLAVVLAAFWPVTQVGLSVTMLEVGKGVAILIRQQRSVWLYGTAESFGTAGRRSETVLLPQLQRSSTLDGWIMPRLTPMTGSGVHVVLDALTVKRIMLPSQDRDDFPRALSCEQTPTFLWQGVRATLSPVCELQITAWQHRISIEPRGTVTLTTPAGQRWVLSNTTARGAISFTVGPTGVQHAPRGLREHYPWVWRAPAL